MPQAVVFRKTNGRLARFDPILIWTTHRRLGARSDTPQRNHSKRESAAVILVTHIVSEIEQPFQI